MSGTLPFLMHSLYETMVIGDHRRVVENSGLVLHCEFQGGWAKYIPLQHHGDHDHVLETNTRQTRLFEFEYRYQE